MHRSNVEDTVFAQLQSAEIGLANTLGEAKFNAVNHVAITGPDGAEDISVGAIQPSAENPIDSSRSDDQPTVDDTIE
jgi:hypothetical protein